MGLLDGIDDRIIAILKKHRGDYVPTDELAEELGVTRSTVGEQIGLLQDQGYGIERHPARGYRLLSLPDVLLEREILWGLKTELLGRNILCYARVGSTNQVAMRRSLEGAPEGTLVIAESQTKGRGRLGRSWYSPKGMGIWASLVLRPEIPLNYGHQVALCAFIGIAKALRHQLHLDARLKWPNDVLIRGRKVAGILTEINVERNRINFIVLGFGLNVNQREEDFPSDLRGKATSLRIETGKWQDRVVLLRRILEEIEQEYIRYLRAEKTSPAVLETWKALSTTLGKPVRIQVGEKVLVGTAVDMAPDGTLIVERSDGGREKALVRDVM